MSTDTEPVVMGVPTDEEVSSFVGGGDREIDPASDEGKMIAQRIQDSAAAHIGWRSTLPLEQRLELVNTPIVSVPPTDTAPADDDSAPEGENGGAVNAGI